MVKYAASILVAAALVAVARAQQHHSAPYRRDLTDLDLFEREIVFDLGDLSARDDADLYTRDVANFLMQYMKTASDRLARTASLKTRELDIDAELFARDGKKHMDTVAPKPASPKTKAELYARDSKQHLDKVAAKPAPPKTKPELFTRDSKKPMDKVAPKPAPPKTKPELFTRDSKKYIDKVAPKPASLKTREFDIDAELFERYLDDELFERDIGEEDLYERDFDEEVFERDFEDELFEREFDEESFFEREIDELD